MTAVRYESADGIALITIDRAPQRNSINQEVVQGLQEAWLRFAEEDDRVAILSAAGDDAFSAGADLKNPPKDIWMAMPNLSVPCDKPIIAAVSGYAIGAGATMVMLSDLAVAAESASFVYPEAKVGAFAGIMGGFPARMPYKVGLEWTLTGEPMSASRAYEIGFVNRLCQKGEQLAVAMELARKIAANAPLVVQTMKHLALETLPRNPMATYYPHKRRLEKISNSQDIQEGIASFVEKRAPRFQGR